MKRPPSPEIEEIFRCEDQSALIHNYVASHDPPPSAWSGEPQPQSPLGQFSFPEILIFPQGSVHTLEESGEVVTHQLSRHQWLPWRYRGESEEITAERAVTKDVWIGQVQLKRARPALLVLECRKGGGLDVTWERLPDGLCFRWGDNFDVWLSFEGSMAPFHLAGTSGALTRRLAAGADIPSGDEEALGMGWNTGKPVWIGIPFEDTVSVQLAVVQSGLPRPKRLALDTVWRSERHRWEEFFHTRVPPLDTDDAALRDTYYFAWQTLWANRCEGGSSSLEKPFISPARLQYGSQWWWDEAFHSVVTRHLNHPDDVYRYFDNFLIAQAEDGSMPGAIRFGLTGGKQTPEDLGYPSMTMQPPVIGLTLQLLEEKPGWPEDLRALYEPLLRLARWHLSPGRDTDQDGLAEYHHSFDTSADQTQRWDSQLIDPDKEIDSMRATESVDYNVWMSLLWQSLAGMAEKLGETDSAQAHHELARRTMQLIEEKMWDEEDGFYYDIDGATHEKIRVKTPYGFMPMLSSFAKRDRIERLVRGHLVNPEEFWSAWPLASVSMDHPKFSATNMMRGPTWIHLNWLVVEGLARQGYQDEAMRLARKTVELVGPRYREGHRVRSPRIWEWYHPHTGQELGNNQYSWSALVIDLILRFPMPEKTRRSSGEMVSSGF